MKKSVTAVTAILALVLSFSVFAKEIAAPFGLVWGQSKQELESMSVKFYKCENTQGFVRCRTKNPPKTVSFAEFYDLAFHQDTGLQEIVMAGNTIANDIAGSKGKALYAKVKSSLTRKYGQPHDSREVIGLKLYDEYDEFYQCLAYSGCGLWLSYWVGGAGGVVGLRLKGLSRGKGWLRMSYQSKALSQLLDDYESKKTTEDEDAF